MAPQKTAEIFDLKGESTGKINLPNIFSTPLRPDVIKRAVLAIQSSSIQPQGRDPMAGKRTTAESRGTGSAIARVPRIKGGSGRAALLDDAEIDFVRTYIRSASDRVILSEEQRQEALAAARLGPDLLRSA